MWPTTKLGSILIDSGAYIVSVVVSLPGGSKKHSGMVPLIPVEKKD
jgi:hypothetical protein